MTTIVFAGGGTAGHIEPSLAVARSWLSAHPGDACIFLGTAQGLETSLIPEAGFELKLIRKVRISRRINLSLLTVPISLFMSVIECYKILSTADLLVGFGGYVSGPAYLAAAVRRIPIVIHEANAKPGWANRLGAALSSFCAVAVPVTSGSFSQALITGMPLRADVENTLRITVKDWKTARSQSRVAMGFDSKHPVILVMGGSQGSVAINTVVANSLDSLLERNFQILHAVGKKNALPEPRKGYTPVYYINEMARAYLGSDLIIARSGAVTCSEIEALGKFALFIPLAIGNGEQEHNARHLVKEGKARIVQEKDFNAQWLLAEVENLIELSHKAPLEGSSANLASSEKIAALMAEALKKKNA
ncbi:unannotated protein [freshwater metagenome]|uniref:Unannotated protein n=1 Tax=freshwater metagenome TaxID=449393 RepID=A0A6J7XWK4_9ZZZZ|nr:UDP-N-acetylglucosamine--N-acetylmuramyl-(pentapeptide) pyrophosphoryl-undecaprenol N-acetylglucosamine transferase [Actinomycetota bacterium]